MAGYIGTVSRGLRAPIIKKGDNLSEIVAGTVVKASQQEGFSLREKDVVAITEAVVARAYGNYATCDDIAADIRAKFPSGEFGVVFPILSRNRFSMCLKGIVRGAKKIYLMLKYPSDEVGNQLFAEEKLQGKNINPYSDLLDEAKYRELFGFDRHIFTGMDYVEYFKEIAKEENCEIEVLFCNDPRLILNYTKNVLCADIHTREQTKAQVSAVGAQIAYTLADILSAPINGSGCNPDYGLLGSNKATEDSVKLFPNNCKQFVDETQKKIKEKSGVTVEVMVYGDGAFKDPVGKIWELADPVVSPAFTEGLQGQPNELKLKYLADNDLKDLQGDALKEAMQNRIKQKPADLVGSMATQGTTPRRFTDLLGSLADLTSGSGDKGTPIVLIQGYFDTYAD